MKNKYATCAFLFLLAFLTKTGSCMEDSQSDSPEIKRLTFQLEELRKAQLEECKCNDKLYRQAKLMQYVPPHGMIEDSPLEGVHDDVIMSNNRLSQLCFQIDKIEKEINAQRASFLKQS